MMALRNKVHERKIFDTPYFLSNHVNFENPVILEPMMKIEVVTPESNMGDVVGDLNRRRGLIEGMDDRAGSKVVKAKVPLSEMFGYVTQLRTITSGRATSSMEFSHYTDAPKSISEDVITKSKGEVPA